MGRPPLKIDVTKKDQHELHSLLKGGVQQVRVVLRAIPESGRNSTSLWNAHPLQQDRESPLVTHLSE